MGSLRNPVGPLPSTIYWRRRVVVFALVALIALLVVWAVTSGDGGGGGKGSSAPTGSHSPAATITAGPTPTGTHITGRPGGRDTAPAAGGTASDGGTGDGTSAGTDAGASAGATAGASAGTDAGTAAGSTDGMSAGTSAGASAGTGAGGDQVPVGSTLPNCSPGTVSLSLTSVKNAYAPGESPVLQLHAANSGSVTCKLDFGARSAVFTVTSTPDGNHVWASNDCPANASPYLLQVPAHGTTTYTLHWNGRTSSPRCAAPKGAQAPPGNYLAQARLPGYGTKSVPFVLSQD